MNLKRLLGGACLLFLASASLAADNTTLNAGAGGDAIRTIDKSSKKAQVTVIDVGGSGTENVGAVCGVEDAAETDGINLFMAGVVRRDTAASSAGTTGDNAELAVDANGKLWVTGAGIEDVGETAGGTLSMCGTVRRDTQASSAGTTGDNATLNTDATGGLWVAGNVLEDAAETAGAALVGVGTVRRDTAASSAGTTGDNATFNTDANGYLYVINAANYIEDAAETAGGNLVMIGVVRRDVLASSSGTTGDNSTANTDARGAMWTDNATRPVAYGSSPTATVAGTYSPAIADLEGRPYVNTSHPRAINCYVTTTSTTAVQVTGCEVVASNSIYITSVTVSGDIANATATPWTLESGTSTACTGPHVIVAGWHPALTTNTMTFPTPIKVTQAEGLCILDGVTGSKTMAITGYVAP